MKKLLGAFQIEVEGKMFDYRLGKPLDLSDVKVFFEKKYTVKKIRSGGRHVLAVLEKNGKEYFLKLATTQGISAITKIEYEWNRQFHLLDKKQTPNFRVPQNYDCGLYKNSLFFLITEKFDGQLLAQLDKTAPSKTFVDAIPEIIAMSEAIQQLSIPFLSEENINYKDRFVEKTASWYNAIPQNVRETYKVDDLLKIVKNGVSGLEKRPRHGDFTPWHIFKLKTGELGLIDAEHALTNGVAYYDIGYFVQRVFCVLKNPDLAKDIFSLLRTKKYDAEKLRVVLAARAIGGFLDESLIVSPDYSLCDSFKRWSIDLA